MKNNDLKITDFDDYLAEKLKNPEFKKGFEEAGRQLEIAYGILKLRKARGMSQGELAKKIGTSQSNVARLESGNENLTISSLCRIADALGCELEIRLK